MAVHGGHSFGDSVWAAVRYCLDSIAFVSVPIAVVLLASRPSLRTIADMAWPAQRDRRLVAVAFWATLLLPLISCRVIQPTSAWARSCRALDFRRGNSAISAGRTSRMSIGASIMPLTTTMAGGF